MNLLQGDLGAFVPPWRERLRDWLWAFVPHGIWLALLMAAGLWTVLVILVSLTWLGWQALLGMLG